MSADHGSGETMKRNVWLFRISLVWIAILLVSVAFAMYAMH
jgi:hypothetical protein